MNRRDMANTLSSVPVKNKTSLTDVKENKKGGKISIDNKIKESRKQILIVDPAAPKGRTIDIPGKGKKFPKLKLKNEDFN